MSNRRHIATVLVGISLTVPALADTEWNYPEDIPVIEPVTVGLAGKKPSVQ